jgi:hypothetical protein
MLLVFYHDFYKDPVDITPIPKDGYNKKYRVTNVGEHVKRLELSHIVGGNVT